MSTIKNGLLHWERTGENTMSLDDLKTARQHYENVVVASRVLPHMHITYKHCLDEMMRIEHLIGAREKK